MQIVGIIPARYGSTRFPGKALARLNGLPLVQHVYEQARTATRLDEVIVATDDERILQAVTGFGGEAVLTSPTHRSGTERVAEVARQRDAQVIVNIQGDEPLIRPEQIDQVAEYALAHPAIPMATLMTPLTRAEDAQSPHVVKVVVDRDGSALYFSRSPIPHVRTQGSSRLQAPGSRQEQLLAACSLQPAACYKHIGLYGYQRDFLLRFPHLTPTPLEQAEQLEQLRALEHGYTIRVLETSHDTLGVDTPEDLAKVEALLANQQVGG